MNMGGHFISVAPVASYGAAVCLWRCPKSEAKLIQSGAAKPDRIQIQSGSSESRLLLAER